MSRVSDAVDRAGPGAVARHGSMVAADHPLAVDAAIECLRAGGSATDAAVRAAMVHPSAGLGREVFAIVWDRERGLAGLRGSGTGEASGVPRAYADLLHRFGRASLRDRLHVAAAITHESGLEASSALAARGAPEWVVPIEVVYRGYSIYEVAPSAVVALEALALLDDWAIPDLPADGREHIQIEAIKVAVADDGTRAPSELLAEPHLERRRAELGPRARAGVELPRVALESVHVTAVDADGQFCSLGIVSPARPAAAGDTGIVVPGPDAPPCVALVFRGGLPWIAIGGPLPPDVYSHILTRLIDFQATPEEAVSAVRRRWLGGARVCFEPGFDPAVVAALEARGHVRVDGPHDFGAAQIVAIDRDSHSLTGASDPRRGGKIGAA